MTVVIRHIYTSSSDWEFKTDPNLQYTNSKLETKRHVNLNPTGQRGQTNKSESNISFFLPPVGKIYQTSQFSFNGLRKKNGHTTQK